MIDPWNILQTLSQHMGTTFLKAGSGVYFIINKNGNVRKIKKAFEMMLSAEM